MPKAVTASGGGECGGGVGEAERCRIINVLSVCAMILDERDVLRCGPREMVSSPRGQHPSCPVHRRRRVSSSATGLLGRPTDVSWE